MTKPLVFTKRNQVLEWVTEARDARKTLGFVPTMGALHEGHGALMARCMSENQLGLLSIFVNPKQFGPQEDFNHYPRTLPEDLHIAEKYGISAVFAPSIQEMYPHGFLSQVKVAELDKVLCGQYRAGHFDGVCTVVLLLLNLARADKAYFGLKDYQQYSIIKRMCLDLAHPTEILPVPTVRESDGLALSSRNRFLDPESRNKAKAIPKALAAAAKKYLAGELDAQMLLNSAREIFANADLSPQYLELRDAVSLEMVASKLEKPAVLAVAQPFTVASGTCRLIDNIVLSKEQFFYDILTALVQRVE